MKNKFELGDLVRLKWSENAWGYIYDADSNGHHIFVHWFDVGVGQPFCAVELKNELLIVAKGKPNEKQI